MKFTTEARALSNGDVELVKYASWSPNDPSAPRDEVCHILLSREEAKDLIRKMIELTC